MRCLPETRKAIRDQSIDIEYHFARDVSESGNMNLSCVPSDCNLADMSTKSPSAQNFVQYA